MIRTATTYMRYILGLFAILVSLPAVAQSPRDTIVSIVTCYAGPDVYELEGHTILRVATPGTDLAISYGMFDFDAPNFVYRFVKGEADYWVAASPWHMTAEIYARQGRRIVERRIDMSSEQKKRLIEFLAINLRPDNRPYRYNYVRDNCSTRTLGALEAALGDSIVLGQPTPEIAALGSWREIMRYYHERYPWYQFGIDLVLGPGIDIPTDNRMKAFAPVILDAQLENATVSGRPLVSETVVVYNAPADNAVLEATPFFLTPLFVFWTLFVIVLAISVYTLRRRLSARWLDSVLFGIYGLTGCLLFFMVFVSEHEATSPNWLIAWLNPLCLITAVGVWIKSARKLVIFVQFINFVLIMAMCVAWPWLPQHGNPAFIPLIAIDLLRSAIIIYTLRQGQNKAWPGIRTTAKRS